MNNPKKIENQVMVIFGASGDLTYRKLLPAIFDLYKNQLLPNHFAVLGVSRSDFSDEVFREKMEKGIKQFSHHKDASQETIDLFLSKVSYMAMDTGNGNEYGKLKNRLSQINQEFKTDRNYIFYLSTPPHLYAKIPKFLYGQGLNLEHKGFRRIIIEKPFGHDLKSAQDLNKQLLDFFHEEQIYRIDHYLGKETVQNLIVTRFANGIYEPLWNRNFIQHIEITAAESMGMEGRGGYYEEAGALRDMVQNHLMQLIALIAMEPPTKINADAIKYEKMKVFQALHPLSAEDLKKNVIRGQYSASKIRGKTVKGYREEENVDKKSRTETFFAMKCFIDNWRWAGVPFYIRTGKRLPTRVSEIVIHFKPSPQQLFSQNEENENQLILRIQPDEGILLKTGMKMPGNGYEVKTVNMDFHYTDLDDHYIPEAYERLLLDCMAGDSTLFMDGASLEETWRFVQPILTYWETNKNAPLYGYPAGSWGPDIIDDLIEGENQKWRYPCKNLSDDGIYCEL